MILFAGIYHWIPKTMILNDGNESDRSKFVVVVAMKDKTNAQRKSQQYTRNPNAKTL